MRHLASTVKGPSSTSVRAMAALVQGAKGQALATLGSCRWSWLMIRDPWNILARSFFPRLWGWSESMSWEALWEILSPEDKTPQGKGTNIRNDPCICTSDSLYLGEGISVCVVLFLDIQFRTDPDNYGSLVLCSFYSVDWRYEAWGNSRRTRCRSCSSPLSQAEIFLEQIQLKHISIYQPLLAKPWLQSACCSAPLGGGNLVPYEASFQLCYIAGLWYITCFFDSDYD